MAANWLELAAEAQVELKGAGADKSRGRAAVNEFASWAQGALEYPSPAENDEDVLSRYTATLAHHRKADGVNWTKNGESAVAWAKELLKRSRAAEETPEPQPEEAEVTNEEELDDDMDDVDGDEELDEAPEPPKRSRQRAAAAPPNIIVQMPSQRQQKAQSNRAVPGKAVASKLIPRTDKIRLYKRDERGKRVQIDEYTAEDFAGKSLPDFITAIVHPRFANEGGLSTEYIAFEVNPRTGQDHGAPFELELEGDENEQPQQSNDPFQQVHRAMGLMKELRGEPEQKETNPAMQQMMAQKASQGDMTGVMMAMMMDKLFNQQKSGPDNEILLKILDRLDGKSSVPAPMQPPPWMMQPPPAPAPQSHASDRIIDLAMAKLVAPEKSAFDMAKEMAQVQQMLTGASGNSEVAALRAEIATLRAQQGRPPPGGLEDSMKTFEQVVTMAKSIAPQVGAGDSGGFGGFIKSLLTPDVARAIAGVVGGTAPQAPAAPAVAAPAQPAAPPARDPKRPPQPAPQAVQDSAKAFMFAQTPPARAERFAEYLISMFMANDPYYTAMLTPAAQALSAPEITLETLKPARGLALRLIAELKPEWATPEFTDVCLAALAGKLEAQVPEALAKSAGAWTLDFRGNVLMLETVARPVVETPAVAVETKIEAKVVEAVATPMEESPPPVVEGYVPHEPYVPAKATPRERPLRNGLVQLTETTGVEVAQAVVAEPAPEPAQPTA